MHKLKLRNRLFLIAAVPLSILLMIASFNIYQSFHQKNQAGKLRKEIQVLQLASSVVNETQKERGASVGFLSGGMKKEELLKQRAINDKSIAKLKKYLNEFKFTHKSVLNNSFNNIKSIRDEVNQKQTIPVVVKKYSDVIANITGLELMVAKSSSLSTTSTMLRVQNTFEESKENAGVFRAKLTGIFGKNNAVKQKVSSDIIERYYRVSTILNLDSLEKNKSIELIINKILNSKEWLKVENNFNVFKDKYKDGSYNIKASNFFDNISLSIAEMNKIIFMQYELLLSDIDNHLEVASQNIIKTVIASVLSLVLCVGISLYMIKQLILFITGNTKTLSTVNLSLTDLTNASKKFAINLQRVSEDQSSSTEQAASAIDEITSMVARNSESSKEAERLSTKCSNEVNRGQGALDKVVSGIQIISRSNEEIASQVQTSEDEFIKVVNIINNISDKTNIINDIVFQTKLLSFNASVEAARAGEHGKGFAVVAEEIGGLAAMSGKASSEIADLLKESTDSVMSILDNNKKQMDVLLKNSVKSIEDGNHDVTVCSEIFTNISEVINELNHSSQEISEASNEQTIGVREVGIAIGEISKVTHANNLSASENTKASEKLEENMHELQLVDERFKKLIAG